MMEEMDRFQVPPSAQAEMQPLVSSRILLDDNGIDWIEHAVGCIYFGKTIF